MMNSLPDPRNFTINIESLNNVLFGKHGVTVSMLRLDNIHPVVSGNKIFKLHYFLDEALNSNHKQIITFGGAYSNHLAATAFACNGNGLKSIGIVRGEIPPVLSHTLLFCIQNGMQLEFIGRSSYQKINNEEFRKTLTNKYGDHTLIPEGGFSENGAKGARLIMDYFNAKNFTHICCAIGTATTFGGLIMGCDGEANLTGFSVLKNLYDIAGRLQQLQVGVAKKYSFNTDYHFGGYAKKTAELITFMNTFYQDNKIPLDFVYTGKMMFGVYDLINRDYFPSGSNILCIHTGGLQGNESLPGGMLIF
jgi:1-aminocyclopropane-1-carboxylate deaminase/D-cysteine desulfhydrase-like pyridoxal-dependent ACC family enzyme